MVYEKQIDKMQSSVYIQLLCPHNIGESLNRITCERGHDYELLTHTHNTYLHCVSLATGSLTIRKYGSIVATQDICRVWGGD